MGKKQSLKSKIKASTKGGKPAEPKIAPLPQWAWPWLSCRVNGGKQARAPTGRMGCAVVRAVAGSGCDGFVVGGYNGASFRHTLFFFLLKRGR